MKSIKIKKMRFNECKSSNEATLSLISGAINRKEKFHTSGRTNYDTSFEYNPELNQAWYSEEYKGCGNGHYYLALSDTYAWFYEDD